MTYGLETRGSSREHVLLLAQLTVDDGSSRHRIRMRDLSPRGLRAQGDVPVTPGQLVEVDFGSAGTVKGVIAWKDDGLFGVALEQEIDPAVVRRATIQKCEGSYEAPRFVRHLAPPEKTCGPARKV
jgi:hypothetical protein